MNEILINITPEEAVILKEVLASSISELSSEIADTDKYDFREDLKKRRIVIHKITSIINEKLAAAGR